MRDRKRYTALSLALTLWPLAAAAQPLSAADAFVRNLYGAYTHDSAPDYLGSKASQVFSPRLLELIRRDRRLTPKDEVPALDGDPICDCQDSGGLTELEVAVAGAGPGRATAKVHFRLETDPRDLTLDLVSVKGRWRVDDVHSKSTPSLAQFLRDAHRH